MVYLSVCFPEDTNNSKEDRLNGIEAQLTEYETEQIPLRVFSSNTGLTSRDLWSYQRFSETKLCNWLETWSEDQNQKTKNKWLIY